MRRSWALACVPVLVAASAAAEAAATKRAAVVVGNDEGGPGRARLRYAKRDAERMAAVLTELGDVDAAGLRVLLDQEAADVLRALDDLEQAPAGAPDVVYFYYSGHADGAGLLMGRTHLPFRDLRARLRAFPSRVGVAFIDACQAGAVVRAKGGRTVPVVDAEFDTGEGNAGRIFVTSSASGEISQESDELQSSFFSHYLVNGLRGLADASGDARVSLDELYRYVYGQTLARTMAPGVQLQHPTYDLDVSGRGQLVVTQLPGSRSYLVFPAALTGRIFVRAPSGEFVAELDRREDRDVRFALAAGIYRVSQRVGDGLYEQTVEVAAGQTAIVDPARMTHVTWEPSTRRKGETSADVISAGYALRTGYLEDAGLLHAAQLGYLRWFDAWALGARFAAETGRYVRGDQLRIAVLELFAGATVEHALWTEAPFRSAAGIDVGGGWVRQTAELADGGVERPESAVFRYDVHAGASLEVLAGLWFELRLAIGQEVYATRDGLRAPPTVSLAAGASYAPGD